MTNPIVQFSYFQVLDFLTTVAFLLLGVEEGNPLVRAALEHSGNPLLALASIKGAAVALGLWCYFAGRTRLLPKMNVMFALVVAWNLVALIVGAARHPAIGG